MLRRSGITVMMTLLVLLTGCLGGNSGTTDPDADGFHSYATDDIRIDVPNSWEIISPVQFTSEVPPNTLIAFRNNIKHPRYTATVSIIKNTLEKEVSTLDYAKALLQRLKQDLTGVKELGAEQVAIKIGGVDTESLMTTLQGSERPESEQKIYIHKGGVKAASAYLVIGTYLPEETAAVKEDIDRMVRSFEVR